MKFIITGHGNFATGLMSSVKLITGLEKALVAIDFEESMSSDTLRDELVSQVKSINESEAIVIFTDIVGGTPFNQSVLLKNENDNIEVVAGTNLPILIEAVLSQESDVDSLLSKLIDSGKNNIKKYGDKISKKNQDFETDDGI